VTIEHDAARDPQFALAKFSPPALPDTLVVRSSLRDQLTAGASRRLTSVVGSAGAGKSVLLADWTKSRPAGVTAWLSCDSADADPPVLGRVRRGPARHQAGLRPRRR